MRSGLYLIGTCLVLVSTACQRSAPRAAAAERVHPAYDQASGRLTRLEYDSDGDGRIDTWGYMDGMRVVRVEVDEDRDGKVDRWEYHQAASAAGPAPEGGVDRTIERIERSTRHDGNVSRREFFDNGVLARVEEDTDGDGLVDKWEQYSGGTLTVLGLDDQHRGKPTRRLIYRTDGSFDHIETDSTASGAFTRLAP